MPIFYLMYIAMQKLIYFNQRPVLVVLLISLLLSELNAFGHDSESGLGTFMMKSPESTDAPPGDEVQLECELNLPPDNVEFRFRPQNSKTDEKDRVINIHNINKMPGYNITTRDRLSKLHVYVNQKTIGDYRCVAWFGASAHASISAKLRLATIALDQKESSKPLIHWKIAPKNSLIIRCGEVSSAPDPVWSYYKNDVLLPSMDQAQSKIGGFVVRNVTSADSGIYSCLATNTVTGTEIKMPQRYSITVATTPRSAPSFLLDPPTEFSARPGEKILLECPGIANPVPKATWSRPDRNLNLQSSRIAVMGHGLEIQAVQAEDEGTYICRLDNGETPVKVHTIKLSVLQMPQIVEAPRTSLTNESDRLELHCRANGSPEPEIYWMINGENTRYDQLITSQGQGTKLIIRSVEKKHAGIVQCFARNEVGEVNEGAMLQVNPKQIDGEGKPIPLGIPQKSRSRSNNRTPNERRKKGPSLPSVSKPNITRLNDESVMVKWSVVPPSSDGSLPIQFFKVQYMMVPSDSQKHKGHKSNEDWITLNEDIPPHLRSYEIPHLKLGHHYKFRLSAVYSNNDNKQSPIRRFHLKRVNQSSKAALPVPNDIQITPVSENEVTVRWSIPEPYPHNFDGFYISYRPTTSADEYSIVSAEGPHKRHILIKHLESGMNYEFKIQSFTSLTASEFSAIVMGRTLKPTSPPTTTHQTIKPEKNDTKGQSSWLPLIVGAIGICAVIFLILLLVFVALKRRRDMVNTQREDQESKSNQNHIQNESTVNGGRGGLSSPIHRNRLNGIIRINITPNPLDEKNRLELASLNNNNCLSSQQNQNDMTLGIPVTPTHQPPNVQQLPPLGPHRKTLERTIRNNHHNQHPPIPNGDLGIPVVRTASIRRQPLRGSNNSINNSPRIVRSHGRHQRSPMPNRAAKRRQDIEQSTASLNSVNSIEV